MSEASPLQQAVRALRAVEAEHSQAADTQQRVLRTLQTAARRGAWSRRIIASLGLGLFLATTGHAAFFGADQTLRMLTVLMRGAPMATRARPAVRTGPAVAARAPAVAAVPEHVHAGADMVVPANTPEQTSSAELTQPVRRRAHESPAPTSAASATQPETDDVKPHAEALYADAHRLHFVKGDRFSALHAWDRYLAAQPSGGLSPEARYNRALCLVALGRKEQAIEALSLIAAGADGAYRRKEASKLLRALRASR